MKVSPAYPMCGDAEFFNDQFPDPPEKRTCCRLATRLSHVYENFSIYVCDAEFTGDHEYASPWMDDTIEDLEHAELARQFNASLEKT